MKNKILISVITASIVSGLFILTGCGGGSSSKTTDNEKETIGSTTVQVSDAYVLGATVKAGNKTFNLYRSNGKYEIAENNVSGNLSAIGGINDLNGNDVIDVGEPYSPALYAPSGYTNITPFTTMIVNNVDIASEVDYQAVAIFAPNYDFDVVEEGVNFENGIAQATAIAALRLSAGGDGSGKVVNIDSIDESLPGSGEGTSSSAIVQSSSSSTASSTITQSSSSSTITSGGGSILPTAPAYRGVLPDSNDNTTASSSSSNDQSSSSIASSSSENSQQSSQISSSSMAASSSSSSSVNTLLEEAIEKIKNAKNHDELLGYVQYYLAKYNGTYDSSSSSKISSSSESQNSEASSSSVIDTSDDCLPGFDCTSSSSIATSDSSSSMSSSSSSSSEDKISECEKMGGIWNAELNGCLTPATSSSSSVAPASGNGSVLPQ